MIDATFWLAIASFIFFICTYKPIKKGILEFLDKEIKAIQHSLLEASSLKSEATALVLELKNKLAEYENEHNLMVNRAKEQNRKQLKQNNLELELLLSRKQKEIALRIEQLKLDAIKHIKHQISSTATNLTISYLKEHQNSLPKDSEITTRLINNIH